MRSETGIIDSKHPSLDYESVVEVYREHNEMSRSYILPGKASGMSTVKSFQAFTV